MELKDTKLNKENLITDVIKNIDYNKIQKNIVDQFEEDITQSIHNQLHYKISSIIEEELNEKIKLTIIKHEDVIMNKIEEAFPVIGAKLAESLIEKASANLNVNGYKFNSIIKDLFS